MATIESQDFKKSICQGGLGNVTAIVREHDVTGDEVNGDVIKMCRMGNANTYKNLSIVNSTTRTTTVNIGFISHDDNYPDDPDYFGAAVVLTNAKQEQLTTAVTLPFEHTITVSIVSLGTLASADTFQVVAETIVSQG